MKDNHAGDERKKHGDHEALIEQLVSTLGVDRDQARNAVIAVDQFVKRAQRNDQCSGGLLQSKVLWNDLRQECFIIVLKTLLRFDPSRGASVATYLWCQFRGLLRTVLGLWDDEKSWADPEKIGEKEAANYVQTEGLDQALTTLPAWFTEDGGWEALTATLAGVPRNPTVFDRWKVRSPTPPWCGHAYWRSQSWTRANGP